MDRILKNITLQFSSDDGVPDVKGRMPITKVADNRINEVWTYFSIPDYLQLSNAPFLSKKTTTAEWPALRLILVICIP